MGFEGEKECSQVSCQLHQHQHWVNHPPWLGCCSQPLSLLHSFIHTPVLSHRREHKHKLKHNPYLSPFLAFHHLCIDFFVNTPCHPSLLTFFLNSNCANAFSPLISSSFSLLSWRQGLLLESSNQCAETEAHGK